MRGLGSASSLTLLGQASRLLSSLLALVTLSRLLDPGEFGVAAVAVAIVGIADLLRDAGITTACVSVQSLSLSQRTNLFWFSILLAAGCALVVSMSSVLIAKLLEMPELRLLIPILSLSLLLNAAQSQYIVQLARAMKFGALAATEAVAQAIGLSCGVLAAYFGASYWSVVVMQLVVVATMLLCRAIQCRWVPGSVDRDVSVLHLVRDGVNLLVGQLAGYCFQQSPLILAGWANGRAGAGEYSRAFQISHLPINQIFGSLTNTVVSWLRLQSDPEALARARISLRSAVYIGGFILYSNMALFAAPIASYALGPGWDSVSMTVRVLAIGLLFQTFTFVNFWEWLNFSKAQALRRYMVSTRVAGLLAVSFSFFLHGFDGVLIAYGVSVALFWPLSLVVGGRIDGRSRGFDWVLGLFLSSSLAIALSFEGRQLFSGVGGYLLLESWLISVSVLGGVMSWRAVKKAS